ncbi:MAG: cob(I)yrinic acid a,c-diamide adenosyltransferase [Bifidobacteriaceae bacterium]|jgi:cob(I)alamin adenosyltransferase|nr:cob(I)yrinic acid a,c-diamide adenosyltransferase [Bifidobacteriaceae bacterium]
MVVLSKITTKTGDEGQTHLGDMTRVPKTDPRIEAVGAIAEANAVLGVARSAGLEPRLDAWAAQLQQELFDLGADLSTPLPKAQMDDAAEPSSPPTPRVDLAVIAPWDRVIAELAQELGSLRTFVLPGGPMAAAQLHVAVTVTRRAERDAWRAAQAHGIGQAGGVNHDALVYLNRLSDLLFLMARAAAGPPELWHRGSQSQTDASRVRRKAAIRALASG